MIVKDDEVKEERKTSMTLVGNTPPKLTKLPLISFNGFKTYTYTVEAEDIDEDTITFGLDGDIPPGMSIDMYTGKITYNFSVKPENNKYTFNIIASDPDGGQDIREITLGFNEGLVKKGDN